MIHCRIAIMKQLDIVSNRLNTKMEQYEMEKFARSKKGELIKTISSKN